MTRVTFALDEATVALIKQTAARLRKTQSHIVREAVADYAARADRLRESERLQQRIGILERLKKTAPTHHAAAVTAELRSLRRRTPGRRTAASIRLIVHGMVPALVDALTGPRYNRPLAAYFLRIASHATGRGALTPVRGGGLRASSVNHQARSAPHPSPGGIASCI